MNIELQHLLLATKMEHFGHLLIPVATEGLSLNNEIVAKHADLPANSIGGPMIQKERL